MKLVALYPEGPLFRGPRGKAAFTPQNIRCRFRRLREKLPHLKHFVCYNVRHTFATQALVNGVGVAQVAELLGHSSTEMVVALKPTTRSGRPSPLRSAASGNCGPVGSPVLSRLNVPVLPLAVTVTGTVKVVGPVTVTTRKPLIDGVLLLPVMAIVWPLVRPCGALVVTTVGFATEMLEMLAVR